MEEYSEITDKLSLIKIAFLYNLFSVLVTLTFCENFINFLRLRSMNTRSQVNFHFIFSVWKTNKTLEYQNVNAQGEREIL